MNHNPEQNKSHPKGTNKLYNPNESKTNNNRIKSTIRTDQMIPEQTKQYSNYRVNGCEAYHKKYEKNHGRTYSILQKKTVVRR